MDRVKLKRAVLAATTAGVGDRQSIENLLHIIDLLDKENAELRAMAARVESTVRLALHEIEIRPGVTEMRDEGM